MATVKQAANELGYKSLANIASILMKRFPKRRQNQLKLTSHLTHAELTALRDYKETLRQRNVNATSEE